MFYFHEGENDNAKDVLCIYLLFMILLPRVAVSQRPAACWRGAARRVWGPLISVFIA